MHILALWRLAAILLLAAAPLAAPALAGSAPAALADNGKGGDTSDDGNRGHGNDPDGVDEDNPGNSGETKDKKDKKDKDDKEKDAGKAVETIPVAGYVVAVDCHPTEAGGATACGITAAAPEGGKDVGFVQVPAEALCAEVVETDAELVDPDPNTHVTGYKSRDGGTMTLTLDGVVTAAGVATYWIKTGDGIFPVEGPGLRCDLAADTAAGTAGGTVTVHFDVTPAATEAPSTGTVAVAVLTCADVPADTAGFDWFGACQPGADPAREFTLAPSDDGAAGVAATTDPGGEATFADLVPGDYRLDLLDGTWCHAASDRVTAESEVVVEAGVTSTVWIFLCDGKTGV